MLSYPHAQPQPTLSGLPVRRPLLRRCLCAISPGARRHPNELPRAPTGPLCTLARAKGSTSPSGRPLDSLPMLQRGLAFAHRGALSGPMREVQPPQDSDVAANELRARQQVPCCALARAKGSTSLLGRPLDSSPMLQGGLAFAHKGTLSGPMREVQPPQDSEVAAH